MGRQQPAPMPWISSLRTASTVFVLLAALGGPIRSASAATPPASELAAPSPAADSAIAALRRLEAAVRTCGASVSAEARAGAEVVVGANAKRVDEAALRNTLPIAGRLALEFSTTPQSLADERSRLGSSWSEIVIAHTLAANLTLQVSPALIVGLHQGGVGWGLIAAGFGLDLSDVVNAVRIECRVATGLLRPDGRVVQIRGDDSHPSVHDDTISAALGAS